MAAALKRENMERTAAQVRRIMVAQAGDAPSERTLQRHFAREDLATPRGSVVFGRFEAEAPNVLWTGDVLHGPLIGGKKTYLVGVPGRPFPVRHRAPVGVERGLAAPGRGVQARGRGPGPAGHGLRR